MAIKDNITAYWNLDEDTGDAADATGNGHTLSPVGSPTRITGLIGNGVSVGNAGHKNVFTAADNCGISGGTISVSLWFNKSVAYPNFNLVS